MGIVSPLICFPTFQTPIPIISKVKVLRNAVIGPIYFIICWVGVGFHFALNLLFINLTILASDIKSFLMLAVCSAIHITDSIRHAGQTLSLGPKKYAPNAIPANTIAKELRTE